MNTDMSSNQMCDTSFFWKTELLKVKTLKGEAYEIAIVVR